MTSRKFLYELFSGVVDLLEQLCRQGIKLHLWTARDEYSATKILREHSLEHFFTTLSFATDKDSKPHANSLKFTWEDAGANQVIVIGDSATDMLGAQNINAICGAALWDNHVNKDSLIASGAEMFFYSIKELKDWLLK